MRIQKNLILFFILMNSSSFTFAQISNVGIKCGLNASKINYEADAVHFEQNYKTGMNIGVFVEYAFISSFTIKLEPTYSKRGYRDDYIDGSGAERAYFYKTNFIYSLDYIDIPLLFSYNWTIHENVKTVCFVGPIVSYLVSAIVELESPGNVVEDFDVLNEYNKLDYGVVIGVGAVYELANGQIVFDARYHKGLTDINKDTYHRSEAKLNDFSLNLGYGFKL